MISDIKGINIINEIVCWLIAFLIGNTIIAQDIEPRRWTELPLGTQTVGAGYAYSFGDVFFDPLLQVEDATVEINTIIASYVRSIRIGTKLGRIDVLIPFNFADWEGQLSGASASLNRTGFSDPRIRFSLNLVGVSAIESNELRDYVMEHPVRTTIGVSVALTLPLGQYFDEKLINLGQNRFIIRPQAGMVHTWRKWSFELTVSTFLFSHNTNFFSGSNREQHPIFAFQSHLIKRLKPGFWASISAGYGVGGESLVNDLPNNDVRADLLAALSFGFPIGKNQGAKIAYIRSQTMNDIGSDLNTFALGWSLIIK